MKFLSKTKPFFFNGPNTFMTILALAPLLTIHNIYIWQIGQYTIHLDLIFFFYFAIEFIIRYKERTLHGIYMYFDIIALISFIPFFSIFRLLLLARLFSAAFRFEGFRILARIIRENKFLFQSILYISLMYMVVTSIIVFNVEPETFNNNYLYALYWSGITLTTVGYGDIYPVTPVGQTVALVSSFLGIGIIALPAGVISSNFILKIKLYEQEQNGEAEFKVIQRKPDIAKLSMKHNQHFISKRHFKRSVRNNINNK